MVSVNANESLTSMKKESAGPFTVFPSLSLLTLCVTEHLPYSRAGFATWAFSSLNKRVPPPSLDGKHAGKWVLKSCLAGVSSLLLDYCLQWRCSRLLLLLRFLFYETNVAVMVPG